MAKITGLSQTLATGGGRLASTKKLVLWSVVLVQVCFIGCIWLLQANHSQLQLQSGSNNNNNNRLELEQGRVHFVRQASNAKKAQNQNGTPHCPQSENINRYQQDFFQLKTDQLNRSADYPMPAYMDLGLTSTLWCYAEGTLNESRQAGRNNVDYLMSQPQCPCASGWHGRDCGQPEIIWRALMTHSRASRRGGNEAPLKLHEASSTTLKRLYYMLNLGAWEHINMELLELQLRTLIKVVDCFLIYYQVRDSKDRLTRRTLVRQLDALPIASYLLYQCEGQSHGNCSGATAYSYFHHQLWTLCGVQIQPKDLLLFGHGETVYAPAALKFLKYFASDVLPLRFRLKHNVYGFYWQHPQRTRLDGVISSLVHMHSVQMDPQRLERQASYTLGDLNHYGGWSCELCMPSEQIVNMLTTRAAGSHSDPTIRMPNETRSSRIDAAYIQQLMGAGMLLDGRTQLLRLRQQSEKYYAPEAALLYSSQFGQLLVNLYDTNALDDVQEDED
ncbi:uncharacterized protein LOC115758445 [Drosophila novamexicana]|uniref:uncharacterized protein LOC115758445 n=1 Tax=Drosophila novamexicana TaxID=47314 RepID=UPI0011E5FF1B|nr:uncharacterized protein LOC115758445 [Drosophila novamexicana]